MSEAALAKMIAATRYVASGDFARDGLQEAAKQVEATIKASAAAGTTPDGEPWAPKKDGGRAMAGAAGAVSVSTSGSVIQVQLNGPEVFHHFGVRGAPSRQVIPRGSMPSRIGDAVRLGFVTPWKSKVGG